LTRFILTLLGAALLIAGLSLLAYHYNLVSRLPSFFFQSLILLVLTTAVIYRALDKASVAIFIQLYLVTIALKILAYGAYIFAMAYKDKAGALQNVVFFLVVYFTFTTLEIVFLYRKKTHS